MGAFEQALRETRPSVTPEAEREKYFDFRPGQTPEATAERGRYVRVQKTSDAASHTAPPRAPMTSPTIGKYRLARASRSGSWPTQPGAGRRVRNSCAEK